MARGWLDANILRTTHCGPLVSVAENFDRIAEDLKVDAILFLHSTYYFDDFQNVLERLTTSHLRAAGIVCALVLPEQSPFFLNLPPLQNCSDAVEAAIKAVGLKPYPLTLKSRFRLPKGGELTDSEWQLLQQFFIPDSKNLAEFKKRLHSYVSDQEEIDFQDHLIVGKSR
jgi:hypothetical protein